MDTTYTVRPFVAKLAARAVGRQQWRHEASVARERGYADWEMPVGIGCGLLPVAGTPAQRLVIVRAGRALEAALEAAGMPAANWRVCQGGSVLVAPLP